MSKWLTTLFSPSQPKYRDWFSASIHVSLPRPSRLQKSTLFKRILEGTEETLEEMIKIAGT